MTYFEPGREYDYNVAEHPVDSPEAAYNAHLDLEKYIGSLDFVDQEILGQYMKGYSGSETANTLGVSPSKVSRHLKIILADVQEILEDVI